MGVSSFRILKVGGGYWQVLYRVWLWRFLQAGLTGQFADGSVSPQTGAQLGYDGTLIDIRGLMMRNAQPC
jgi:hypothetical protein